MKNQTILYIGGFELPDKNAAAQRVIGIAKGLRELGHSVLFLNSLKEGDEIKPKEVEYFGFKCYEYKRERECDYLLSGKTAISMIRSIKPNVVIAYNYPAVALERIRRYCKKNKIKCLADATEWYQAVGRNAVYRIIKNLDTAYRMRIVQKRLDGVITISRFLFDYYNGSTNTVIIPPTIDLTDRKWNLKEEKANNVVSFIYAGVPIALKEKLDVIVQSIEEASKTNNVVLNIVGITERQFVEMYNWKSTISSSIVFWGRIEHTKVIEMVNKSNWAIILRDNNRVVKAGFPTKLVESISCGTPVIVNRFSNICDYIDENNGMIIESFEELNNAICNACKNTPIIDKTLFDYHRFLSELRIVED